MVQRNDPQDQVPGVALEAILARIDACTCFHDLLPVHLRERPTKVALSDETSELTYSQLHTRAHRIAAQLNQHGLKRGERIALLSKNDVAFVDLMMAASITGVVLVPLNFRLAQPEIDFIVQDSEAKLIFSGRNFLDVARSARDNSPNCNATIEITSDGTFGGWNAGHTLRTIGQSDADAVLFQMYTSGTTGHQKGVQLTHKTLLALCRNDVQFLGPFRDDARRLACMPLFHVAGNGWLFFGMVAGCRTSLVEDISPEKIFHQISKQNLSCTLMVPAVVQMLVLAAEEQGRTISGLKTIAFGAAPMPAELLKRAQAICPETDFIHVYGMPETTYMICVLDPSELRAGRRPDSCGTPFPDTDLKIVDPDGNELPVGTPGEIICRTPQMTPGYWHRREATARSIQDGWYYTGDAGLVDAEGFLYIRDRLKDLLISGGENVYPAEVENAVLAHASVAEVVVIGVPDQKQGEVGLAVVVLRTG
ncbi:MAG: AMP-binding protein [Pseudomonadota bacterium]